MKTNVTNLLSGCGPGVRAMNAHLFGPSAPPPPKVTATNPRLPPGEPAKKRIKQSQAPVMNKLETRYYEVLKQIFPGAPIKIQAMTLKLANGLRYTPDFIVFGKHRMVAIETKGKWVDGDSIPKLKMAAAVWPEIQFTLVWEDGAGHWREQEILP